MKNVVTKIVACLAAAAIPVALAITQYPDASLLGIFALIAIVLIANH